MDRLTRANASKNPHYEAVFTGICLKRFDSALLKRHLPLAEHIRTTACPNVRPTDLIPFPVRVLTGVNQQHFSHPLSALFLQQGIELFATIAEIHITTVAERNHAITQIRLEARVSLIP